jgi:long-chain fatty acid transport protein
MSNPFPRTRIATAVGGLALLLGASQAFGTGFQLNEQSGSSIGNAFAAGAAFTDDASAMWWNPAALSKIPTMQAVGVLNVIKPSVKFRNDGSQPALNQPLGGDGGDAGGWNFVPNMYLSVPINKQFTFGLGVTVPFGLTTEYDDGWLGRYQALKSSIETMNVNPAIAWQVTPEFSVGAGVNWQKIKAELTQNTNYSYGLLGTATLAGIPAGSPTWNAIAAATPGLDGFGKITADDDAWGWNIGLAWDASPQLRLAAAYRSEMKYQVTGNVEYTNPTPTPPAGTPAPIVATIAALSAQLNKNLLFNRGVSSDITLPQIANFSMLYRINPRWEMMADVQWTGWSSIPALSYESTPPIPSVPLAWDDTYKIAVGASYKYNDQWKARFGVAFDQTPVTNEPTARLPDSDRWWFAIGGEYKMSKNLKLDAGLVYITADSPNFTNHNAGSTAQYGSINGSYDANVAIISLQGTYSF